MLFAVVIALSAFLIFLVQPLVAKQILPWFGGSAAVWTTSLVFFQTALLAGYLYSDWAPRRLGLPRQARLHGYLALSALAALPITVGSGWKPDGADLPELRIFILLTLTIGLPYFVLSATSPLVQLWYGHMNPGRDPYRLFALSNAASLLALLSYPFLIGPAWELRPQAWIWSGLFVLFALLMFTLARRVHLGTALASEPVLPTSTEAAEAELVERKGAAPAANAASDTDDFSAESAPGLRAQLWWLLLAATASAALLSITNHLTENIASFPLLWVMPLALYLVTFILCFDGRDWYSRATYFGSVLTVITAMGWMLVDKTFQFDLLAHAIVFGVGLFIVCMFCHGELVAAKPHPRFLGRFYVLVSLGGASGSICVAFGAPLLLPSYYEVSVVLGVVAALLIAVSWRWSLRARILAVAGFAGVVALASAHIESDLRDVIWTGRNFYGVLKVREHGAPESPLFHRRLVHGGILHGEQYLDESKRRLPTMYYTETSGVGRAIGLKMAQAAKIRVGMIGLGVGTIATYARPGDTYRFYEINPLVPKVANRYFSFLKDAANPVEIILGDARLSLEREEPQGYDLLIVDAFSGDAIPAHLITLEAVQLFRHHLALDGILAYHVSNRYLDLAPILGQIAKTEGIEALQIDDDNPAPESQSLKSLSVWVLLAKPPEVLAPLREVGHGPAQQPTWRPWTDQYDNLFQVIRSWRG